MTEHAMPDAAPNIPDLFAIMRTARSMRRLEPDPVPPELIRKILSDFAGRLPHGSVRVRFAASSCLMASTKVCGASLTAICSTAPKESL